MQAGKSSSQISTAQNFRAIIFLSGAEKSVCRNVLITDSGDGLYQTMYSPRAKYVIYSAHDL